MADETSPWIIQIEDDGTGSEQEAPAQAHHAERTLKPVFSTASLHQDVVASVKFRLKQRRRKFRTQLREGANRMELLKQLFSQVSKWSGVHFMHGVQHLSLKNAGRKPLEQRR